MTPPEIIRALHTAYCEATGFDFVLSPLRMFAWDNWMDHGSRANPPWGPDQMSNTIAFLHCEIRNGARKPACLKFSYLVENPEAFEQELQLARKDYLIKQRLARKPKFGADKASVCRSGGYADAPPDAPARSAETILSDPAQKTRLAQHLADLKAAAGVAASPPLSPPAIPPE